MMEVVSGVASIAALTELAIKSYSSAARLIKDLRDAPRELLRVTQQLNILNCELALLSDIQNQITQGDEPLLLQNEVTILELALLPASEIISDAHSQLCRQKFRTGNRSRLIWALKDKTRVEDILHRLQQTESSLTTVLLLLNV